MLIELRVENHRSVRDEQVLTMAAGRGAEAGDPRARELVGFAKPLLPVAALYGANASGKSNLLGAAAFMRDAVMHSHRLWSPDGGVPREPFAWGTDALKPSLFEATFLLNGTRYAYGFVATDEEFVEEWLFAWPKGRKQIWFERDGMAFKFGEQLRGENKVVEEVTRNNALFLSAAVQHRHRQLLPVYTWFRSLRTVALSNRRRGMWLELGPDRWIANALARESGAKQQSLFGEEDEAAGPGTLMDAYRALLSAADVGIVDVKIEDGDDDETPGRGRGRRPRRPRIFLRHKSTTGEAWLPLEEESQGTLTLFRMAPMVIDALFRGGVLIVDELEASLHPLLALHLIRQFNDPQTNRANAQLIFTTHDTNLLGTTLGEPALRRDQIWLTEKDEEGATTVYPLTDYKPRKAENLERGYLQGRYGAIPFLSQLNVAGA